MLKVKTKAIMCAAALACSFAGAHACLSQGVKKHFFAREFYKVSESLYCGSEPTSKDKVAMLKGMGVKTIIDLRLFTGVKQEELWAKEIGVDYFHISTGVLQPDEAKIKIVLAMVDDPKYQPLYVHCRTGCDRTGVIVGLYRVCNQGWTKEAAYKEMLSHHFRPVFFGMKRKFDEFLANPENSKTTPMPTTSWIEQPDARD